MKLNEYETFCENSHKICPFFRALLSLGFLRISILKSVDGVLLEYAGKSCALGILKVHLIFAHAL